VNYNRYGNDSGVKPSIAVLGAGSWGTALAISLSANGCNTTLWARRQEVVNTIRHEHCHPTYLPGLSIPETITVTADLKMAASGKPIWVIATPSHAVRALAQRLIHDVTEDMIIVSVAKGIENDSLLTTTQILESILSPPVAQERIGVLYGPSHAEEVAAGKPTTLVAAAPSLPVASYIQSVFMTSRLRVYVNDDVRGVEIGGSVKNVIAIAAGISDGIGYGDNAKAALITRGMAEIKRLGVAMGANSTTFAGLTGIGDLVVTCTSPFSRNRYLGEKIGRGRRPEEVQAEMQMIAEGVRTAGATRKLARQYGVEMPIMEAVYAILFEGKKPADAVQELMTREAKHEDWLPDHSNTGACTVQRSNSR